MTRPSVFGPTFAEMRDPQAVQPEVRVRALDALAGDFLSPLNLYNITWRGPGNRIPHRVLPSALTGVSARIVVVSGARFPSGSHKVGPVYSILMEKQLDGEVEPGRSSIVCPSTGNYGIGAAWVGPRMGYHSLVVLPENVSVERFEMISAYGGEVLTTPGTETDVKEVFDRVRTLRRSPDNCVLDQYSEFGNYRFHYEVTGNTIADLVHDLQARGVGAGRVAAFVSAMGSAGTMAAGDRLRQLHPSCAVVGLEPVQCPTLFNVGFGSHRIEGIGDKHVTWIHHVHAMDYLLCIDDGECLLGLQLVQEGTHELMSAGVPQEDANALLNFFGVSGICNVLGAIKTARLLGLGPSDVVVTVATDGFDRYPSVIRRLTREHGPMGHEEALRRLELFRNAKLDWVLEGTRHVRERWHNQKYFTWVEQQGRSVAELKAQADPDYWLAQQAKVADIDRRQLERRRAASP
ncbi:MAG: pyridoxal-phosphate dependent enzyme [Deltaproteobacteria bacterium]|nr:pyridoxal-phosphate dependent enzyme [Deltaproteobacteria bacterium]